MSARRRVRPVDLLPTAPALVGTARGATWLSTDGCIEEISAKTALARLRGGPALVCHMPATAVRLGHGPFISLDVLELFAFVRPTQFCVPTPRGLAAATGLELPISPAEQALALRESALTLLAELARPDYPNAEGAAAIARRMAEHRWPWGATTVMALGASVPASRLDIWNQLPEWTEQAPELPPGAYPVEPDEARARLASLLGPGAEERPQQADYASAVTFAFRPRDHEDAPRVVLAEAGTGVGKTLGYIAPASVWADKNDGTVWLSTYTKNLQRQIDRELDRLYPDPIIKATKVVVRKGRENYFCLLNFSDAVDRGTDPTLPGIGGNGVGLGLIARWAERSRDGDMAGGDFPGWLSELVHGVGRLTDRRGECVYSACTHWRKCFIERSTRKARNADLVIANHALIMALAASGEAEPRYVLDEGHHLFDAADSAFAAHLSGLETRELRRWLRGAESTRRGRARGLARRAGDLIEGNDAAVEALAQILAAARALPADGWLRRVADGEPEGPAESFLTAIHNQVRARAASTPGGYSLEASARPLVEGLIDAANALDCALVALASPMERLQKALLTRLDDESENLDTSIRIRLEATAMSLRRRRVDLIAPWRAMLKSLSGDPPEPFVDWFAIERRDGHTRDIGMRRHWIDPGEPFSQAILRRAHGSLITSATLRDRSGDEEADWHSAAVLTGVSHLDTPPFRAAVTSPFDYASRTRVLIVNDVKRDDPDQVSAAYRALFLAAGGGALGLFTAIWRLRQVQQRLIAPIEEAGLTLLAQHVDAMDTATLVDIFRAERHACLLGTNALRDGVDVPGDSLRLIVFDRVPWPRPDILHKARRSSFGGRAYDDRIVRMRIRQAYGRLLRSGNDAGVFVLLDPATPSRLMSAFPDGVESRRVGLAEAVEITKLFLARTATDELTERNGFG
jgi:ATP-dependent DNA helicase DinG